VSKIRIGDSCLDDMVKILYQNSRGNFGYRDFVKKKTIQPIFSAGTVLGLTIRVYKNGKARTSSGLPVRRNVPLL